MSSVRAVGKIIVAICLKFPFSSFKSHCHFKIGTKILSYPRHALHGTHHSSPES